jgi:hypothetical protein
MRKSLHIPDALPVSPLSLICPLCRAEPGKDCISKSGGFSEVHLIRIRAAAMQDAFYKNERNYR